MTKSLYLFDDKQKVIKIIAEKYLTELVQKEELNEDGSLPIDRLTASFVVTAYKEYLNPVYMAVKDLHEPNNFHMYYINQPTLNGNTVRYEGVQLGYHELKYEINRDYRPQNRTALEMYTQVLKDTEWRVGYVSDDGRQTTNFYYQPALDSIQQIANLFGQDIVFKVEISGNKITDKWLESYSQRGDKTMKRFTHGSNALTIEQSVERGDIYTALIGRGKGEETESGGFGRRLQFDDVVWGKANGNPVDKPAGQDYVEIPEATALYGILNADGTKKPRIGVVEFTEIEDKNELIRETYDALVNLSRPLVQYKTTISDIGNVQLGETVTIHRFDLGIHYQTRVFKIERNYLNIARTPVSLGDVLIQNRAKREASLNKTVNNLISEQELIKEEVSYVVQSADGFNTITYGNTEPTRKRVGDSWVRDDPVHEGYTEWLRWNGTDWVLVMSSWDSGQLRLEIQEVIAQAETDRTEAVQKINQAVIDSKIYADEVTTVSALRTKVLASDVITADMIQSNVSVVDKLFATDANVNVLTAKTAFINSVKAVDISADKITTGTLFGNNVTASGINVSTIVGNVSNFIQSYWNGLNTSLSINSSGLISVAGSLSTTLNAGQIVNSSGTKSGTVNALGMQIYDSSNGKTTRLHSDGIEFQWYGIVRGITQHSEGLEIRPTTGSGSRLNSALHLITGPGNDKVAYLQLANPDGGTNSRLEMNGTQLSLRHPNGGSLDIADYNYNGLLGRINAGKFRTTTTDGRGIQMEVSQISALAGNQTIYIMPSGTGELRIGNGSANPTLWPVRASQFIQGSSRASKTNIRPYTESAVALLNKLNVVSYNRLDDLARGVIQDTIGFIAEDSPAISVQGAGMPAGVDNYKMVTLAIKGVQELSVTTNDLEIRVKAVEEENRILKQKLQQLESAA